MAKALSTFTATERGDFIYQLIITYCEARREDQPKIIVLMKELTKKNVLARTHFLQRYVFIARKASMGRFRSGTRAVFLLDQVIFIREFLDKF